MLGSAGAPRPWRHWSAHWSATLFRTGIAQSDGWRVDQPRPPGVPNLGASGAIAAVLGAYIVLYARAEVRGLLGGLPARIMTWVFERGLVTPTLDSGGGRGGVDVTLAGRPEAGRVLVSLGIAPVGAPVGSLVRDLF
jgi:hypothetical protein